MYNKSFAAHVHSYGLLVKELDKDTLRIAKLQYKSLQQGYGILNDILEEVSWMRIGSLI